MISRAIPVLMALALLSMRLAADITNLVNEPGRRLAHSLLGLATLAAIAAIASRRTVGWFIGVAYCVAQTARYGYVFRRPTFIGLLALLVMLVCTLLLLHPDSRDDFG